MSWMDLLIQFWNHSTKNDIGQVWFKKVDFQLICFKIATFFWYVSGITFFWYVSGITFFRYAQSRKVGKPNNLKFTLKLAWFRQRFKKNHQWNKYANVPKEGYSRNVPKEGYSRNVPKEGYSRNASCALWYLLLHLHINKSLKL
jgi:hypothetical protein